MKNYDSIIIGAGPAGLTAALYLARKKSNVLVVTEDIGGQFSLAGAVENFPSHKSISGQELMTKIYEQVESLDVPINYEKIQSIKKEKNLFSVTSNNKKYQAHTIIITSGKFPRKLDVPGEEELTGRGVAYCATCDAPNFRNVPVAVIGGGNSAMDSVLQISKYTDKIFLIDISDKFIADQVMQDKVEKLGSVTILHNKKTIAIKGEKSVSGIEIENIKTKKRTIIKVAGVFITIGWNPATQFEIPVKLNNKGEIIIDKNCLTNISGIFAAGDVTDIEGKQAIIASGEGAKAALSAFTFLMKVK